MSDVSAAEKWIRRIETSGLLALVDATRSDLFEVPPIGDSEDADVRRVVAILDLVTSTLECADPVTVSETALAEIHSQITNVCAQVEPLRSTLNPGHLANVMQYAEAILAVLPRVAVPRSTDEAAATLKTFKLSVAGSRAQSNKQFDEFQTSISAALAALHSRVEAIATDVESHSSVAASTAQQVHAIADSQRNAFDEAQITRSSAFEAELKSHRDSLKKQFDEFVAALDVVLNDSQQRVNAAVESAVSSDERINVILGIVAEKGLVAEYSKTANRERTAALRWRIAAGVVALGAVAAAVVTAVHSANPDGSWRPIVSRLALTLVVGALAGYCGSVANDHRRAEQQAESTALQLAAMKPYLNDLTDPGLRNDVIVSAASRLFGTIGTPKDEGSIVGPGLSAQVTDGLMDNIVKAVIARLKT